MKYLIIPAILFSLNAKAQRVSDPCMYNDSVVYVDTEVVYNDTIQLSTRIFNDSVAYKEYIQMLMRQEEDVIKNLYYYNGRPIMAH